MTMSNADQATPPSTQEQESAAPGLAESNLQAVASHAWYVCQTKPRQENLALRKLEEQGYQVYLPLLAVWKPHKDGWQKNDQVMFPRYAFVRCARPGQSIAPIRSTPGVTGLVSFGNVPASIDDTLVEAIRQLAEKTLIPPTSRSLPFRLATVSL